MTDLLKAITENGWAAFWVGFIILCLAGYIAQIITAWAKAFGKQNRSNKEG